MTTFKRLFFMQKVRHMEYQRDIIWHISILLITVDDKFTGSGRFPITWLNLIHNDNIFMKAVSQTISGQAYIHAMHKHRLQIMNLTLLSFPLKWLTYKYLRTRPRDGFCFSIKLLESNRIGGRSRVQLVPSRTEYDPAKNSWPTGDRPKAASKYPPVKEDSHEQISASAFSDNH